MRTNIKKNKDGYYLAKVRIGRDIDTGKAQYKYIRSKKLEILEKKKAEYEKALSLNIDPDKKYTFTEVSEEWLKTLDVSNNTRRQYQTMLNEEINAFFGRRLIKDLRKGDFDKLIVSLRDHGIDKRTNKPIKRSDSYFKKVKIICNGVMNYAFDNNMITGNPFMNAKLPRSTPKEREALTEQQQKALLEHWNEHRIGIGALIMFYCGLRRGELLALKWNDIDMNKGILHVRNSVMFEGNKAVEKVGGKTDNAVRDIPIPRDLKEALLSVKKESPYVCYSSEDKGVMTQTSFRRAWNGLMRTLNLACGGRDKTRWNDKVIVMEEFTPHQLRHTYATMLYYHDVKIKEAQYYLGHADIKTTLEIYTHLDKKKMTDSMKAFLEAHFNDGLSNNRVVSMY